MAVNPHSPSEAYNLLCDVARRRGYRVGLTVGKTLLGKRGAERRDLDTIEVRLRDGGPILIEAVRRSDLNEAAHRLLARLPAAA
jgi:hypothetical protein